MTEFYSNEYVTIFYTKILSIKNQNRLNPLNNNNNNNKKENV